jgi:hypothetical protein
VRALAAEQGQAEQERVHRDRRVHVEVAEEDLPGPRHADGAGGGRHVRLDPAHDVGGPQRRRHLARRLVAAEGTAARGIHDRDRHDHDHGGDDEDPPEHGCPPCARRPTTTNPL